MLQEMASSRFNRPSLSLSPNMLAAKSRGMLGLCLAIAVLMHLLLSRMGVAQADIKAAKPLTTQFVKRQPRLTKPLELKKRPQPKRRRIEREMVSVKARAELRTEQARFQPTRILGGLARPKAAVRRGEDLASAEFELQTLAETIQGDKESQQKIDLSLELLDVGVLDTGRYHAMVVQDPTDRREIRGFFRMASVWSQAMSGTENWGSPTQSVIAICKAVQKYTNVQATMAYQFGFDSEQLLKTPLVFTRTSNSGFELTASETKNLGRYLKAGGLLFGDEGLHKLGGAGDRAFRLVIQQAMESQGFAHGLDWVFERLPDDHAVYHCYFDFEGGPPMGEDWRNKGPARYGSTSYPYLEAVHIGQQAVVLYSMKGLLGAAAAWGKTAGYTHLDPTRVRQFLVNVVIFALTQEGSITKRVMDEVQ